MDLKKMYEEIGIREEAIPTKEELAELEEGEVMYETELEKQ